MGYDVEHHRGYAVEVEGVDGVAELHGSGEIGSYRSVERIPWMRMIMESKL